MTQSFVGPSLPTCRVSATLPTYCYPSEKHRDTDADHLLFCVLMPSIPSPPPFAGGVADVTETRTLCGTPRLWFIRAPHPSRAGSGEARSPPIQITFTVKSRPAISVVPPLPGAVRPRPPSCPAVFHKSRSHPPVPGLGCPPKLSTTPPLSQLESLYQDTTSR